MSQYSYTVSADKTKINTGWPGYPGCYAWANNTWRDMDQAFQGKYAGSESPDPMSWQQRIGVISFTGLSALKGTKINSINLSITFSSAGASVNKKLILRKSHVQGGINTSKTPRDYAGFGAVGTTPAADTYAQKIVNPDPGKTCYDYDSDILGILSGTFRNTTATYTLTESSYPDLFSHLKEYIEAGNDTIVFYNADETNKYYDGSAAADGTKYWYSYDYLSITSMSITANYSLPYTITLNGNGGSFSSGSAKALTKWEGISLTLPSDSTNTPSKSSVNTNFNITGKPNNGKSDIIQTATRTENFTFTTWNTKPDGSGTTYYAGGAYNLDGNITLYAIYNSSYAYSNNVISSNTWWSIARDAVVNATYNATFNGNGGSCSVSSLSSRNITSYSFDGWYANNGGLGTKYNSNSAFTSATTIYADWNSSTDTESMILPASDKVSRSSVNTNFNITGKSNNGASDIVQTATRTQVFTFTGWNTKPDGSGTSYNAGGSYKLTGSLSLYAIYSYNYTYSNNVISSNNWWSLSKSDVVDDTYTVTFNGNGGTCSVGSKSANKITSYSFDGWFSGNNGTGTEYTKSSAFTSATTLYANWNSSTRTESVILPTASNITRKGYDFISWNTAKSGTGSEYAGGYNYTPTSSIILYAIYKAKGLIGVNANNLWKKCLVWVFDGTKWRQVLPRLFDGTKWKIGG